MVSRPAPVLTNAAARLTLLAQRAYRARFPAPTRIGAYRRLIDTIRSIAPELEIGLCLEDRSTFEALGITGSIGRCNCVL